MSQFNPNIYEEQILAKGRDLPKAGQSDNNATDYYFERYKERYPDATREDYQDHLHDFLNGM